MRLEVELEEATPISGGLIFKVLTDPQPPLPGWRKSKQSRQTAGRDFRDRGGSVQRRIQMPQWEINGLIAASDSEPIAILSVSPKSDPGIVVPVRVDLSDSSITSMTDTQRDVTVKMVVPEGQYGVEINDTLTAWVALGRAQHHGPRARKRRRRGHNDTRLRRYASCSSALRSRRRVCMASVPSGWRGHSCGSRSR